MNFLHSSLSIAFIYFISSSKFYNPYLLVDRTFDSWSSFLIVFFKMFFPCSVGLLFKQTLDLSKFVIFKVAFVILRRFLCLLLSLVKTHAFALNGANSFISSRFDVSILKLPKTFELLSFVSSYSSGWLYNLLKSNLLKYVFKLLFKSVTISSVSKPNIGESVSIYWIFRLFSAKNDRNVL